MKSNFIYNITFHSTSTRRILVTRTLFYFIISEGDITMIVDFSSEGATK